MHTKSVARNDRGRPTLRRVLAAGVVAVELLAMSSAGYFIAPLAATESVASGLGERASGMLGGPVDALVLSLAATSVLLPAVLAIVLCGWRRSCGLRG